MLAARSNTFAFARCGGTGSATQAHTSHLDPQGLMVLHYRARFFREHVNSFRPTRDNICICSESTKSIYRSRPVQVCYESTTILCSRPALDVLYPVPVVLAEPTSSGYCFDQLHSALDLRCLIKYYQ